MIRGLLCVVVFGLIGGVMACSSDVDDNPEQAECEKAKECGELADKTVDQCFTRANTIRNRMKANSDCNEIVEKEDAFTRCRTALSCADRNGSGKCNPEFDEWTKASDAAGEKCPESH
jgi:hypothetical protein